MLIVLVVLYSGLLLYLMSGPAVDDVDDLRKVVFMAAFLAVVVCGILIFLGLQVFSVGTTDEPQQEADDHTTMLDEEEVLPGESPPTAGEETRVKAATKKKTPGKRKAPSKRKTPRRSTRERPSADEG